MHLGNDHTYDHVPTCIFSPSRRINQVQAEGKIEGARRILVLHQVLPGYPRAARCHGHPVSNRQRDLREELLHTGAGDFEKDGAAFLLLFLCVHAPSSPCKPVNS